MPAPKSQETTVERTTTSQNSSPMTSDVDREVTLSIGTAPVNWNNDDLPNWRPLVPFGKMLDSMAHAGYAGTEYGALFPRNPNELRTELDHRDLRLCGSFLWLHFQHPNVFALELAELDN